MSETDGRLVVRARGGDREAFEALVRRHLRTAFAAALGVLGDEQDAEDASQDAFVMALERLEDCRQPERFGAWLARIARNRAHDVRRRRSVRSADQLDEVRLATNDPGPLREAERASLRCRLLVALAELPEVERTVVLMHDLEGWRHREIAEQLGIPSGTARSHLSHARRKLRALLGTTVLEDSND